MNHCLQPTTASNCHVVSRVPYSLKVLQKHLKAGKKIGTPVCQDHIIQEISTLFLHPTVGSVIPRSPQKG